MLPISSLVFLFLLPLVFLFLLLDASGFPSFSVDCGVPLYSLNIYTFSLFLVVIHWLLSAGYYMFLHFFYFIVKNKILIVKST